MRPNSPRQKTPHWELTQMFKGGPDNGKIFVEHRSFKGTALADKRGPYDTVTTACEKMEDLETLSMQAALSLADNLKD